MKKILSAVSVFLLLLTGCKEDNSTAPPIVNAENNGFETYKVANIFAQNCATSGCHSGTSPEHNLNLSNYYEMLKGSLYRPLNAASHGHKVNSPEHDPNSVYGGEAIIPYNAEKSLLYNMLIGNLENPEHKMPYLRASLSGDDINTIKEWINNGAKDFQGNVPFSGSTDNVYVCNQGSDEIYEINTSNMLVSRIISVDVTPNLIDAPHNIQVRGDYIYVSLVASGRLLKISRATDKIVGSVTGIDMAGMVVISPDGKTAYVSRSSTSSVNYPSVFSVNIETMSQADVKEINLSVPGIPHAMALTGDGAKLYVANMNKDRISVVNTATGELEGDDIVLSNTGSLTYEPMHMYLSPDDQYLYVNCRTSKEMLVIKTATNEVLQHIPIKDHPMQSAVTKDGTKIYTVSHHEPYITEITKNGESWSITKEFTSPAFEHLYGCDLSPDGKYLYAVCSNAEGSFKPHYQVKNKSRPSLVCVYDTKSGALVKVMDVGSYATGISAR